MSVYSTYTDQELASLLKGGDAAAFTEVFCRYDRLLFAYAYKKLRDKEASRDVVQDVFTALWNSRHELEMKISVAAYLYTAVRNRALNIFRDKGIDEKYLASLGDFMKSSIATTDYLVREKDIQRLIEKEIAALPERMRMIFIMRKQEFMTNKEIAEQLELSEQTVETHMKRALKTLRLRLGLVLYLVVYLDLWHLKK